MNRPTAALTALLLSTAPSSASVITATLQSNFTTNSSPTTIGPRLFSEIMLTISNTLPSEINGTFTFTAPNWTDLVLYGSLDTFISSSQTPNPISPTSFVTFQSGTITDWSISGSANGTMISLTPYLTTVSLTDGSSAQSETPTAWTSYTYYDFPVPAPTAGAGLPGLLALLLLALKRSKNKPATRSRST